MTWLPTDKLLVVKVAVPEPSRADEPIVRPPSEKVTDPVGVPEKNQQVHGEPALVTTAVKVMPCPDVPGLGLAANDTLAWHVAPPQRIKAAWALGCGRVRRGRRRAAVRTPWRTGPETSALRTAPVVPKLIVGMTVADPGDGQLASPLGVAALTVAPDTAVPL